nr:thioredoxin domain-containing protein [Sandaracinobacteroides sayramensis]
MLGAGALGLTALRRTQPIGLVVEDSPVLARALAEPGPEGGNPEGGVTLIVFTDFNCGACRRAHPEMLRAVEADGDVKLRFLDWPIFGDDSRSAARAAIAADAQGLYLPVHSALMQGGRADGPAAEAALEAAGGDVEALRAALEREGARIEGQLSRNAVHAFALGLGGTPGHLAGRVLVRGAVPERDFRRAIERARKLA